MNSFEVNKPILNSPFEEPASHWYVREGEEPEKREGRRPAVVFPPKDRREEWDCRDGTLFPSRAYP
jgi:type III restriction enzyme